MDKHTVDGETPVQLCNYTDAYKKDRVHPGADLMRATATADEIRKNRLKVGDSVFTKDSEDPNDIGVSAFIDGTGDDFVCGYHLAIARPFPSTHGRFLNWALRSRPVLEHFGNHAAGISRYGIGLADLRSAPIPLVEADEQRRIADFLDDRVSRIDRIIAARREQMQSSDDHYVSWLQEHVDALGHRFGWVELRRLGMRIEQGWSPEADSTPAAAGEPGVLKLGAVRGGTFHPDENKGFLDGTTPRREYLIGEGDLLMTRANTPALVGEAAVVENVGPSPLYLSDLIYRIKLARMDHTLAAAAVRSARVRQEIGIIARGTSGSMPKLRGTDLARLEVPLVPTTSQLDAGRADTAARRLRDARRRDLQNSIDLLTEYKSSLITAAVTGKLDVSTAGSGIPG